MNRALLLSIGFVAFVLAGCAGTATQTTQSSNARATVALRELARCVRAHGMADFPDPQVDSSGHPTFPDSAPRIPTQVQQACREVAAQIPPDYTATAQVSTADYEKLLRFARCMRAHGVRDWPDPNALGEFAIDARIRRGGKQIFGAGADACARLNPDPSGGIHVIEGR